MHTMRQALTEGVLHSGAAKKLAGRLNWAVQYLFHWLGRAMIRPIYDQAYSRFVNALHCVCVQDPLGFAYSRNGSVGKELRVALTWWLWALGLDIMEERPWTSADEPLAHLFVDARGSPAHCAAVLFIDGIAPCSRMVGHPRNTWSNSGNAPTIKLCHSRSWPLLLAFRL